MQGDRQTERIAQTELNAQELRRACVRSAASLLGFSHMDMLTSFVDESVKQNRAILLGNNKSVVAVVHNWTTQMNNKISTKVNDAWDIFSKQDFWKITSIPKIEMKQDVLSWLQEDAAPEIRPQTISEWENHVNALKHASDSIRNMQVLFPEPKAKWAHVSLTLSGTNFTGTTPRDAAHNVCVVVDKVVELTNQVSQWYTKAVDESSDEEKERMINLINDEFSQDKVQQYVRSFVQILCSTTANSAPATLPTTIVALLARKKNSGKAHWASVFIAFLENLKPTMHDTADADKWSAWITKTLEHEDELLQEFMIKKGDTTQADPRLHILMAFTFGKADTSRNKVLSSLDQTRNRVQSWAKSARSTGDIKNNVNEYLKAIVNVMRDCCGVLQKLGTSNLDKDQLEALATNLIGLFDDHDGLACLIVCERLFDSESLKVPDWIDSVRKQLVDALSTLYPGDKKPLDPAVGKLTVTWTDACKKSKTAAADKLSKDKQELWQAFNNFVDKSGEVTEAVRNSYQWFALARNPESSEAELPFVTTDGFNSHINTLEGSLVDVAVSEHANQIKSIRDIMNDASVYDIDRAEQTRIQTHIKDLTDLKIEPWAVDIIEQKQKAIKRMEALSAMVARKNDVHNVVKQMLKASLTANAMNYEAVSQASIVNSVLGEPKTNAVMTQVQFSAEFRRLLVSRITKPLEKLQGTMTAAQQSAKETLIAQINQEDAISSKSPAQAIEDAHKLVKLSEEFKDSVYPVRVIVNIRTKGFKQQGMDALATETARQLRNLAVGSRVEEEEMAFIVLPGPCPPGQKQAPHETRTTDEQQTGTPMHGNVRTSRRSPSIGVEHVPTKHATGVYVTKQEGEPTRHHADVLIKPQDSTRVTPRVMDIERSTQSGHYRTYQWQKQEGGAAKTIGPFFSVQLDGRKLGEYVDSDMNILTNDVMDRLKFPTGYEGVPVRHHIYSATGVSGSGKTYALLASEEGKDSSVMERVGLQLRKFLASLRKSLKEGKLKEKVVLKVRVADLYGERADSDIDCGAKTEDKKYLDNKGPVYNGDLWLFDPDMLLNSATQKPGEPIRKFQGSDGGYKLLSEPMLMKDIVKNLTDLKMRTNFANSDERHRFHIRETPNNPQSSRAHMMITAQLETESGTKLAKISLLDMAGTEKVQAIKDSYFTKTKVLRSRISVKELTGASKSLKVVSNLRQNIEGLAVNRLNVKEVTGKAQFVKSLYTACKTMLDVIDTDTFIDDEDTIVPESWARLLSTGNEFARKEVEIVLKCPPKIPEIAGLVEVRLTIAAEMEAWLAFAHVPANNSVFEDAVLRAVRGFNKGYTNNDLSIQMSAQISLRILKLYTEDQRMVYEIKKACAAHFLQKHTLLKQLHGGDEATSHVKQNVTKIYDALEAGGSGPLRTLVSPLELPKSDAEAREAINAPQPPTFPTGGATFIDEPVDMKKRVAQNLEAYATLAKNAGMLQLSAALADPDHWNRFVSPRTRPPAEAAADLKRQMLEIKDRALTGQKWTPAYKAIEFARKLHEDSEAAKNRIHCPLYRQGVFINNTIADVRKFVEIIQKPGKQKFPKPETGSWLEKLLGSDAEQYRFIQIAALRSDFQWNCIDDPFQNRIREGAVDTLEFAQNVNPMAMA